MNGEIVTTPPVTSTPSDSPLPQGEGLGVRASHFLRALDRRLLLSGALAILIALGLLVAALFGPPDMRFGAAVGLIGLLVIVQIGVLFIRPPDRSPFGKARAAFAAGDYAAAITMLEAMVAARSDVRALTLLGNSYRQVGRLADSRMQLELAVQIAPKNTFALFGLGRTLLTFGEYEAAADRFGEALAAGAPINIACELGLAEYLAGDEEVAARTLARATRLLTLEAHRAFLVNGLLCVLCEACPGTALTTATTNARRAAADGLAYWQDEAIRHASTPFGAALTALLSEIDRVLNGEATAAPQAAKE